MWRMFVSSQYYVLLLVIVSAVLVVSTRLLILIAYPLFFWNSNFTWCHALPSKYKENNNIAMYWFNLMLHTLFGNIILPLIDYLTVWFGHIGTCVGIY